MGTKRQGRYTVMFEKPPLIRSYAAIVGEKESEGPLGLILTPYAKTR